MPRVSVVIASQNAEATVAGSLGALRGARAEVIVVDNSSDHTAEIVRQVAPEAQLIRVDQPALIPHLWARGAAQASGEIVAFTTAFCVPADDWLERMLLHHGRGSFAGVGGAIDVLEPASLTQWAIHFIRYAPFLSPFTSRQVRQIPGDNLAYRRWVLERYAALIATGLWEATVNERLVRDGHALLLTSDVRILHGRSVGALTFCRQRFAHGRVYGGARVQGRGAIPRAVRLLSSPLIPAVLVAKIGREVFKRPRYRMRFLLALPLVVAFAVCWSAGEFIGYLAGPRAEPVQDREAAPPASVGEHSP